MKSKQPNVDSVSSAFKVVPIVRLDSGAIRIPVEFIENISVSKCNRKVLRITIKDGSFWAWR